VKKYTVTVARQRLAEALDEAERGVPVYIERRGVRYQVSVSPRKVKTRKTAHGPPAIEIRDPAVARGRWTWGWSPKGLNFRGRRR
jgi:hypothetical protein